MTAALQLSDLCFSYPRSDEPVLIDLTLHVEAGERLALVGPSGSGKTTLLSLIAGFVEPERGTIELAGEVVSAPGRVRAPRERGLGMVFQEPALWDHLTTRQHLEFVLNARRRGPSAGPTRAERSDRIDAVLSRLELDGLSARTPDALSGGEAQRLALARALVGQPHLLLLDEPFSSLDRPRRDSMLDVVREVSVQEGQALLLVTHDYAEAQALATRVAVIEDGRIVQVDTPEGIYRRPRTGISARFGGPANILSATGGSDGSVVTALGPVDVARSVSAGSEALVVLRPEQLAVEPADGDEDVRHSAEVVDCSFREGVWRVDLRCGEQLLQARSLARLEHGARVTVRIDGPGAILDDPSPASDL